MVRSAEGKLEPKIFFRTKEKYKKLFCKQLDGASITLGAKNIGLTLFKGTFDAKNIGPTLFDSTFGAKNISISCARVLSDLRISALPYFGFKKISEWGGGEKRHPKTILG